VGDCQPAQFRPLSALDLIDVDLFGEKIAYALKERQGCNRNLFNRLLSPTPHSRCMDPTQVGESSIDQFPGSLGVPVFLLAT